MKKWPEIIEAINKGGHKRLYSNILQGKPLKLKGNVLTVGFGYDITKKEVEKAENKALVENYISSICGSKLKLNCAMLDEVAVDKVQDDGEDFVKKTASIFGDDIVEVEE